MKNIINNLQNISNLIQVDTTGLQVKNSSNEFERVSTAQHLIIPDSTEQIIGFLPIEKGGTGATTADQAIINLGINPDKIGAAASEHNHDTVYLKKIGGDVSGNITVRKSFDEQAEDVARNKKYDKAYYFPSLNWRGTDGGRLGFITSSISGPFANSADDRKQNQFQVSMGVSSKDKDDNYFSLGFTEENDPYVWMKYPQLWRKGLKIDPILIYNGGEYGTNEDIKKLSYNFKNFEFVTICYVVAGPTEDSPGSGGYRSETIFEPYGKIVLLGAGRRADSAYFQYGFARYLFKETELVHRYTADKPGGGWAYGRINIKWKSRTDAPNALDIEGMSEDAIRIVRIYGIRPPY